MDAPDYSHYTATQLKQVLLRIDATRFPERVRQVEARLAALAAAPAEATPAPADGAAVIAPVWRRAVAFLIDVLILGLIGVAAGALLFAPFSAMGAWGRLLGFAIAVLYLGCTQSAMGGGRSPGMRVLGLRVVTRGGELLSLPAAFLRTGIFCLPYFFYGVAADPAPGPAWLATGVSLLCGALLFGILYLLLFNRPARQSLHDLAVGAVVVKGGPGKADLPAGPLWRGHAVVAAVALLVLCVAAVLPSQRLEEDARVAPLRALQQTLVAMPGVERAGVFLGSYSTTGSPAPTRRLDINIFLAAEPADPDPLARRIAQTVLQNFPQAAGQDAIVVTFIVGYDIGIARAARTRHFAYTSAQWRAILANGATAA